MLNPQQAARVRRLSAAGFGLKDILHLTKFSRSEVYDVLEGDELERTRRKWLAKVPPWWCGEPHEYVACVEANFGSQT